MLPASEPKLIAASGTDRPNEPGNQNVTVRPIVEQDVSKTRGNLKSTYKLGGTL